MVFIELFPLSDVSRKNAIKFISGLCRIVTEGDDSVVLSMSIIGDSTVLTVSKLGYTLIIP